MKKTFFAILAAATMTMAFGAQATSQAPATGNTDTTKPATAPKKVKKHKKSTKKTAEPAAKTSAAPVQK